jgi:NAD(P)-dependent dehydrogenase (short-subunit alcohol dehydrogenase family)
MRKRIAVIDGQGGGIGSAIIQKIKEALGESVEIIALGTNAIATAQMLKAKANRGASGENAIVRTAQQVDVIVGPLAIVLAHAMMGEVTPPMAASVAASAAPKILLPLTQENVTVVGGSAGPLPHLVNELVETLQTRFLGTSPADDAT